MKCTLANTLLNEIDKTIADINGFTSASPLEKSYYAKYLTVYVCGVYEEIIETIINEMVSKIGNAKISRFIQETITYNFSNPKITKVTNLLNKFDPTWTHIFDKTTLEAKTKFDSIANAKNNIAHGTPSTITLTDIIDYYKKSKIIIETLDNALL